MATLSNLGDHRPSFHSLCVGPLEELRSTKPHQLPIYATSSFVMEGADEGISIFAGKQRGHVYSRYGNPTIDSVAAKIAQMEAYDTDADAWALMTSSGMAAIHAILVSVLEAGDTLVTQGNLYGGTTELLEKVLRPLGIHTVYTDLTQPENLAHTLDSHPSARAIYAETPSNPTMDCIDLAALAEEAQRRGLRTIVDNTFCTPYLQRPLSHGIDYVVHSTTKYLNGHGNSIAGAIVGKADDHKMTTIWQTVKLSGGTCNAWDAWLVAQGMKTLTLRMDRHSANALSIAQHLDAHPRINKVHYNGLADNPYHHIAERQMYAYGGMLSMELDGDQRHALAFMDALQITTQAPTLGDTDSLVLHPLTSSHLNVDPDLRAANGITETLVRMSVGIEHVDDLIMDIDQALKSVYAST